MNSILSRLVLACVLLPCLWTVAGAQAVSFPEPGAAIPGHPDVTYLDLAKMIVPDGGSQPVQIRHITGGDEGGSPPPAAMPAAAVLTIWAGGKDRLVMLYDLGQSSDSAEGFAVLALYDLSGKPRLLDAANVAVDRSTSFREPAKLPLGAGDDAIVTMSTHFNSNQGYVGTLLIMVREDRFELIDAIYTFDENYCAYRRTQSLAFQTNAKKRPYAAIKVTVTDATEPSDESCDDTPPKAASHDISVTYRWDKAASHYKADSDAFERLSAENEKRF
ncbi:MULTISPECIES: hypothetical protein [unclassified Mesorhizobium]|uniref:hypothetical protein n=1 Tax=unclassified Mesorhizobium TaxID=325217 RepID=UPI000BAFE73F|nr:MULTISPECIES: hypothetical protein [unclassified Mesorhizobium]AZO10001.1 hypothetical protein EJ074_13500 [Mesorhizobium sp. M3A.F.Ca.ET.080.04.2.1]PBB86468.1 hypothetical protein CK216_12545 [Mesorhizobium sp. WSM3876]RWB75686.1 MAG: hypothetical protein EOQ49_04190 [Mesorhizobium sp.]RWB86537.1 MAG: hypothetical protein EOQ52_19215 [Mesorhizobium sp.]RWE25035.1 MAG: hypothetical protein EOS41_13645 [Mesorhizobium sp.]